MKKLLLSMALLCGGILSAQDLYLSGYLGYGLGFPGEDFVFSETDTNGVTTTSKDKLRLGGGANAGASFGIMIDDGVGFELNVNYQMNFGQNFVQEQTTYVVDPNDPFSGFQPTTVTAESELTSWSVRISPALRLEADMKHSKPFITIGPTLSIQKITETSDFVEPTTGFATKLTGIVSGKLSLGLSSTVGYEFELDRDIYLTTAIQGNMGYFKPSSATYAGMKVNYEDEVVEDPNNPDMSMTTTTVAETWDYSSVNLLVGVRFVLD